MRKIVLMLLLITSISVSGWAKESPKHSKKNKKAEEKLQILKPTWDCWHIAIDCINGFFCATNISTAIANAQAIALQYCPCPPEQP